MAAPHPRATEKAALSGRRLTYDPAPLSEPSRL